MSTGLRVQVLGSFKFLLKARAKAFKGDTKMLTLSRNQIFEEFRKNKDVSDPNQIKEMMEIAQESSRFLIYGIAQALQNSDSNYNLQLNPEQVHEYMESDVKVSSILESIEK
jgi:hypothetical protein